MEDLLLKCSLIFNSISFQRTIQIWDFSIFSSRKCWLNTQKTERKVQIELFLICFEEAAKWSIESLQKLAKPPFLTRRLTQPWKMSPGYRRNHWKPRLSNWKQHLFLEYIQHKGIFWNINFKYQYYYTEWSTNTDDYLHIYDIRKNMPTFLPSPLEPMLIRVALETRKVQFVI